MIGKKSKDNKINNVLKHYVMCLRYDTMWFYTGGNFLFFLSFYFNYNQLTYKIILVSGV